MHLLSFGLYDKYLLYECFFNFLFDKILGACFFAIFATIRHTTILNERICYIRCAD